MNEQIKGIEDDLNNLRKVVNSLEKSELIKTIKQQITEKQIILKGFHT